MLEIGGGRMLKSVYAMLTCTRLELNEEPSPVFSVSVYISPRAYRGWSAIESSQAWSAPLSAISRCNFGVVSETLFQPQTPRLQ